MGIFEYDKYKFSTKSPMNLALDDVVSKREEEIEKLKEELLRYKILIKDLIHESPEYKLRNEILNIAYFIIEDIELFEFLDTTKKFPLNRLLKRTPIKRDFFIQWKEYIIIYVLILSNPNYRYLQDYIQIDRAENIINTEEIVQAFDEDEHRGIILTKRINSAIILTSKGEFIKIKCGKDNKVGEDYIGKESFSLKKYKLHISIVASILAIFTAIGIFQYKFVDKTITIETTSRSTLEVNKFNKVIDAYSRTEKATYMLKELNVQNQNIEDILVEILRYSLENEMIPDTDIIITVTGEALKSANLDRVEDFVKESGLQVKLNNSGYEYKVSP